MIENKKIKKLNIFIFNRLHICLFGFDVLYLKQPIKVNPGKSGDTKPTGLKCFDPKRLDQVLSTGAHNPRRGGYRHNGGWVAEERARVDNLSLSAFFSPFLISCYNG